MSQPVVWGCEMVVSFGRERKEGGAVRAVAFRVPPSVVCHWPHKVSDTL